jgi:hypothetical protein
MGKAELEKHIQELLVLINKYKSCFPPPKMGMLGFNSIQGAPKYREDIFKILGKCISHINGIFGGQCNRVFQYAFQKPTNAWNYYYARIPEIEKSIQILNFVLGSLDSITENEFDKRFRKNIMSIPQDQFEKLKNFTDRRIVPLNTLNQDAQNDLVGGSI